MNEKEISKMMELAKGLGIDAHSVEQLKDMASKKGVLKNEKELNRDISPKFQDFLNSNMDITKLSNEEKARLILDYRDNLTKEEKKQFDKVLELLKVYLKRMKEVKLWKLKEEKEE